MKLILYATIILSTLCSISEAGWFFSKDVSEDVAKDAVVNKAHWEETIKSMDNQIAEVSARRDAADLETSAESDDVEDQCDAELIRLRKRKQEIVKAFIAWQNGRALPKSLIRRWPKFVRVAKRQSWTIRLLKMMLFWSNATLSFVV